MREDMLCLVVNRMSARTCGYISVISVADSVFVYTFCSVGWWENVSFTRCRS